VAERSEAKNAKQNFASKIKIEIFDTKLRFALLAALRLSHFLEKLK
jgi:hypothetical protein